MHNAPRPPLTKRLRRRHWIALDVAFSAGLTAITWLRVMDAYRVFDPHGRHYAKPSDAQLGTVLACVVLIGAAAALRRWKPLPAALAVFTAWTAIVAAAGRLTIANLAGFQVVVAGGMVVYLIAATRPPRTSVPTLALALIGACLSEFGSRELWNNLVLAALCQITAWALGYAVARYRAYGVALREHQSDAIKGELAEERIRLARELHDVIAHSMSVVNVQAGYGRFVIGDDPAQAAQALAAIQTVSRDALQEMRGMLSVLRDGSAEIASLVPAPGLTDVERLVATSAEAGLAVDLRVTGHRRGLSPGIELSAFRILQEALTNVVKHAHTDTARVTVDYGEDALTLDITDAGRGGPLPADPPGHGLAGMRERVGLYEGTLEAGPLAGGGFRVRARLPLGGPR